VGVFLVYIYALALIQEELWLNGGETDFFGRISAGVRQGCGTFHAMQALRLQTRLIAMC
jgi:hypothetical protein